MPVELLTARRPMALQQLPTYKASFFSDESGEAIQALFSGASSETTGAECDPLSEYTKAKPHCSSETEAASEHHPSNEAEKTTDHNTEAGTSSLGEVSLCLY